jgi:nucleoside-diphosphate-sugar epimerase
MAKIIITGASGFIGTNLLESLLQDPANEIINIDIVEPRFTAHRKYWRDVDVRNLDQLSKLVTAFKPNYIFHLAARTDLNSNSIEDYSSNTIGVENLVAVSLKLSDLRRVIFVSSLLVCRLGYQQSHELDFCPNTAYGESKVTGEMIVRSRALELPWVIVRPTSIWGPWFAEPYRDFFEAIEKGIYVHSSKSGTTRSYGFVLNTVYQLKSLCYSDAKVVVGKTFYLADYEALNLMHWATLIQKKLGAKPIKFMPLTILKAVALTGDGLNFIGISNFPLTSRRLNNLLTDAVYDVNRLKLISGDLPYSLNDGVEITLNWLKFRHLNIK